MTPLLTRHDPHIKINAQKTQSACFDSDGAPNQIRQEGLSSSLTLVADAFFFFDSLSMLQNKSTMRDE
jgi:hypothetical protein